MTTSVSIPVPAALGATSAWVASGLTTVAAVVLAGGSLGTRVALFGQASNAAPPTAADFICFVEGPGVQAFPIPVKAYYAVATLGLPVAGVTCQLNDSLTSAGGSAWSLHEALVYSGIVANQTGVAASNAANALITIGYKMTPVGAETAYGVAIWYLPYSAPNDITVAIYRVSDSALMGSATRTLGASDTGVVAVTFADVTLAAGVDYYVCYYMTDNGGLWGYWISMPTASAFAATGAVVKSEGAHPMTTVEGFYHLGAGIASPTTTGATPCVALAAMLR